MQASGSIVQHFARLSIAAKGPSVRQAGAISRRGRPAPRAPPPRKARPRLNGTSGLCFGPCMRCGASRCQVASGRLVRVRVTWAGPRLALGVGRERGQLGLGGRQRAARLAAARLHQRRQRQVHLHRRAQAARPQPPP